MAVTAMIVDVLKVGTYRFVLIDTSPSVYPMTPILSRRATTRVKPK